MGLADVGVFSDGTLVVVDQNSKVWRFAPALTGGGARLGDGVAGWALHGKRLPLMTARRP